VTSGSTAAAAAAAAGHTAMLHVLRRSDT